MSRAEITTPEVLDDESVVELSLRPQRLAEFIGQQKVKESLRIYIDAALARREPLDHTLFFGPPGLGKTTLAELIARELGVNIRTSSGPALEKPGDLVATLTNLRSADIRSEIIVANTVQDEVIEPLMRPPEQLAPLRKVRVLPPDRHAFVQRKPKYDQPPGKFKETFPLKAWLEQQGKLRKQIQSPTGDTKTQLAALEPRLDLLAPAGRQGGVVDGDERVPLR